MTPSDTDFSTTDSHVAAESLGDEIATLCSVIYAAEAQLMDLIYRFDKDRCFEKLGFSSTAAWLNYRCGFEMSTARTRIRVAHALQKLPKIKARFASGEFSYSKVRAVTQIADEQSEDYLEMIAEHGSAYHVAKLVAKVRGCKKALELSDAVYEARELSVSYDESGAMILRGRFPAEQGALIVKALEREMEREFRDKDKEETDEDVPAGTSCSREPITRRRADALSADCRNQSQ